MGFCAEEETGELVSVSRAKELDRIKMLEDQTPAISGRRSRPCHVLKLSVCVGLASKWNDTNPLFRPWKTHNHCTISQHRYHLQASRWRVLLTSIDALSRMARRSSPLARCLTRIGEISQSSPLVSEKFTSRWSNGDIRPRHLFLSLLFLSRKNVCW
jgi:hypothetical protein